MPSFCVGRAPADSNCAGRWMLTSGVEISGSQQVRSSARRSKAQGVAQLKGDEGRFNSGSPGERGREMTRREEALEASGRKRIIGQSSSSLDLVPQQLGGGRERESERADGRRLLRPTC